MPSVRSRSIPIVAAKRSNCFGEDQQEWASAEEEAALREHAFYERMVEGLTKSQQRQQQRLRYETQALLNRIHAIRQQDLLLLSTAATGAAWRTSSSWADAEATEKTASSSTSSSASTTATTTSSEQELMFDLEL